MKEKYTNAGARLYSWSKPVSVGFYWLALMLILAFKGHAQTTTVTGVVKDFEGEALPGVNVIEKGTTNGTITDIDGKYSIAVSAEATLIFSYIGYLQEEEIVNNRAVIDVNLVPDITQLDELVVIGYGTQRKVDLTGSVAIVDSEEMKKVSNSNMSTMLQGRAASVQITTDGQPGADPIVRIRGIGSFGSTNPLYIIDGVPIGETVRDFSPNDIETIQILKDASAAAIYGSRAGNGVIIITTKSGKKNQPLRVDYSGYVGFDQVEKGVYDVMDSRQYGEHMTRVYSNSNMNVPAGYDPSSPKYIDPNLVNTNWQEEAFKTGIRQNHNINLSGGGEHNTYNVALDYFKQQGTIEGAGPNFDRYTARFKNTMDVKFIKLNTNVAYSFSDQDNMGLSNANEYVQGLYGAQFPVMASALILPPTIKAYDESTWVLDDKISAASGYAYDSYGYGTYYDDVHGDLRLTNVLLTNNLLKRNTKVNRLIANASATVDLLDMVGEKNDNHKFDYTINLSYNKTNVKGFIFIPAFIQSTTNYLSKSNERLVQSHNTYNDALIENFVTYDGNMGRHHINAVAGHTFERHMSHELVGEGVTLSEPYYLQLNNAQETSSRTNEGENVLTSYIGRVNYNYGDKYLVSLTARRDGSSKLSVDRFEWFPSASVGWRLDQEEFFPLPESTFNLFKIRGSYGVLGNDRNLIDYPYTNVMARGDYSYSFGNNKATGSAISNFVSSTIRWEKKRTLDIGLDLGMFNNQLEFTFDWYKATSEDLHLRVPVPLNAGVTNDGVEMNAATMVNSGLEFALAYHNDQHAVKFDIAANFATLNNKVTSLGISNEPMMVNNSRTEAGREVGLFYGYVYEGIFQSQEEIDNRVNANGEYVIQEKARPGDVAYADLNNDGHITNEDRTFLGSGLPDFTFGLNVRAVWKNFDLSVHAFGATGFKVEDFVTNSLRGSYRTNNKNVELLNSWTPDNPNTDVPRVAYTSESAITNDMFSQRLLQDGTYLKIGNIQLGYNFPDRLFGNYISNVRMYVTAQNAFTFTKYEGYNIDFAGGTLTPGYNYASYPTPRTLMFGAQFSF